MVSWLLKRSDLIVLVQIKSTAALAVLFELCYLPHIIQDHLHFNPLLWYKGLLSFTNASKLASYSTLNICALMPLAFTLYFACFVFLRFQKKVFYRWSLMQLCNKYLLKAKRKVISLDNSEIQQLLNFFFSLLTWALRVWGNISSLFLVILRWRLCSSGISNLTSSPICRNELFMEKNNPSVEFTVFSFLPFFCLWCDFTWVKVSSC